MDSNEKNNIPSAKNPPTNYPLNINPGENTPSVTRRQFLREVSMFLTLAIIPPYLVADWLVAENMPTIKPILTRGLVERSATDTFFTDANELRKSIENQFQIILLCPSNGVQQIDFKGQKRATEDWDAPRLELLRQRLAVLPPHFYAPTPNPDGQLNYVQFALVDLSIPDLLTKPNNIAECQCADPQTQTIVFDRSGLPATHVTIPEGRDLDSLAHELIHRLTRPQIGQFAKQMLPDEGLWNLFRSEIVLDNSEIQLWANNLDLFFPNSDENSGQLNADEYIYIAANVAVPTTQYYLLGKAFYENQLAQITSNRRLRGVPPPNEPRIMRTMDYFFPQVKDYRSTLGYGATNIYEFPSVAGETYVHGRSQFISRYKPYLGDTASANLYANMKTLIFRNAEYP